MNIKNVWTHIFRLLVKTSLVFSLATFSVPFIYASSTIYDAVIEELQGDEGETLKVRAGLVPYSSVPGQSLQMTQEDGTFHYRYH